MVAAFGRAGNPASAMNVLRLYITQNPLSIPANRLAAKAYLETGQWDRAAATLEWLRRRTGGEDALLLSDLAWARLGQGNAKAALTLDRRAYALQPSSPVTSAVYGWASYKAGGAGRTRTDLLDKDVAISPQNPLRNLHMGEVYAKAGKIGRAHVCTPVTHAQLVCRT